MCACARGCVRVGVCVWVGALGCVRVRDPKDNYMEWEKDVEDNVTVVDAHAHLHSIFFGPVDTPAFGDKVFYVQQ